MSTFGSALWGGGGGDSSVSSSIPTTLVSDLLYHALRLAGVTLGPERTPSRAQYGDALRAANRMLGVWNTNGLVIPYVQTEALFTLTLGQQAYTMGPSGDIDTTRPQRIERANLVRSDGTRKELELIEVDRWADLRTPDESGEPERVYSNRAPGLVTLLIWPQPDDAAQLELFTWHLLERLETEAQEVTWPDGYEEAFVYNLGVRLATMFQLPVNADVREIARTSLSDVQSLNAPAPTMQCDPSIVLAGQVWRTETE